MALSKEQACEDTLESLEMVWNAVSKAADSWAKEPGVASNVATMNIQTVIIHETKDIQSFAAAVAEEAVKDLLKDLTTKLAAYKNAVSKGVVNATELVRTWKKAVKGMITDIVTAVPAVKQTDRYVRLQERFAAA